MQVTVTLNSEEEKALTKRAKKNMMTIEEQVYDIVRRSCVNFSSKKTPRQIKVDDKLVGVFSRQRTGRKKKK